MHASRLDWHGTARVPLQSAAQLFNTARRAIPAMAHGGLISDPSASAAGEKPDLVMSAVMPGIEHPGGTLTFTAREDQISPPITGLAPMAADRLHDRFQGRVASRATGIRQHELLVKKLVSLTDDLTG